MGFVRLRRLAGRDLGSKGVDDSLWMRLCGILR